MTSQQQQACKSALLQVCLYDFSATAGMHGSFAAGLLLCLISNSRHSYQLCRRFVCMTSQQQQACMSASLQVCLCDFSVTASMHIIFAAGLLEWLLSNSKHAYQLCCKFVCMTSQQQQACILALLQVSLNDFAATASMYVSFDAGLLLVWLLSNSKHAY